MTETTPPIVPVDMASEPERGPLSDHAAYVAGLEASRDGVDLAEVVYIALARWPGDGREVSAAIASAAVGWCACERRKEGPDGETAIASVLRGYLSALSRADRRALGLDQRAEIAEELLAEYQSISIDVTQRACRLERENRALRELLAAAEGRAEA